MVFDWFAADVILPAVGIKNWRRNNQSSTGAGNQRASSGKASSAADPPLSELDALQLLLDLIEGDQTLFVRRDEVESQWHWIDAIRAGWEAEGLTPKTYTAGSWGPSAAIALAERDGVTWHE